MTVRIRDLIESKTITMETEVLGTLPMTADGCICGFPPGFGSLFGKGRHVDIDRYDPVSMRYDNRLRACVLVVDGVHGGREFDGIPIYSLYSTESAARAAAAKGADHAE